MISLSGITKCYPSAKPVLDGIDLTIQPGEIFGIIGRSGAGKSTLVRCMNLLERPSAGKVEIDGVDLCQLPAKALRAERHQISMIFQHFNLLESRNVYDNIALPLELIGTPKNEIAHKVEPLLELTGLAVGAMPCRVSCLVAKSNGWRLPGPWPMIQRYC